MDWEKTFLCVQKSDGIKRMFECQTFSNLTSAEAYYKEHHKNSIAVVAFANSENQIKQSIADILIDIKIKS